MRIEQSMRDWQARLRFFGKPDANWPSAQRSCDGQNGGQEAPPFPPDGFYDSDRCNPDREAELVDALTSSVYTWSGILGGFLSRSIPDYTGEILTPIGQSPTGWFESVGLPPAKPAVDRNSYCSIADKLNKLLSSLTQVDVSDGTLGGRCAPPGSGIQTAAVSHCLISLNDAHYHRSCCFADNISCIPDTNIFSTIHSMKKYSFHNRTIKQDPCFPPIIDQPCDQCEDPGACQCPDVCWIIENPNDGRKLESYSSSASPEYRFSAISTGVGPPAVGIRGMAEMYARFESIGAPWFFPPVRQESGGGFPMSYQRYGAFDFPGTWTRPVGDTPENPKLMGNPPVEDPGPMGWQSGGPMVALLRPDFESTPDDVVLQARGCQSCGLGDVTYGRTSPQIMISLGSSTRGQDGYILIRSDTLLGSGEEMMRRVTPTSPPVAGPGAIEVCSPGRSLTLHAPWINKASADPANYNDQLIQALSYGRRHPYDLLTIPSGPWGICQTIEDPMGEFGPDVFGQLQRIQVPSGTVIIGTPVDEPAQRTLIIEVFTHAVLMPVDLCNAQPPSNPTSSRTITLTYVKPTLTLLNALNHTYTVTAHLKIHDSFTNRTTVYKQSKVITDFTLLEKDPLNAYGIAGGTVADREAAFTATPELFRNAPRGTLPKSNFQDEHAYFEPGDERGTWSIYTTDSNANPSGPRLDVTPATPPEGYVRSVTIQVRDAATSAVSYTEQRNYKLVKGREVVSATVLAPSGEVPRSTTYQHDSLGRLTMVQEPSGLWRRFEYEPVPTGGRVTREVSSYLGSTYGTPDEPSYHDYRYTYTTVEFSSQVIPGDIDWPTGFPTTHNLDDVTIVDEYIQNQRVARSIRVDWSIGPRIDQDSSHPPRVVIGNQFIPTKEVTHIQCATIETITNIQAYVEGIVASPSTSVHRLSHEASLYHPDELGDIIHHPATTPSHLHGRPYSRWETGGQYSLHQYATYSCTQNCDPPGVNANVPLVRQTDLSGTLVNTTACPVGVDLVTNAGIGFLDGTIREAYWNNHNTVELDRSKSMMRTPSDSQDDATIAERSLASMDSLYRPTGWRSLDGSLEEVFYSCCDVDRRVDAEGLTTLYGYDNNHRPISVWSAHGTPAALQTTTTYDQLGRVTHSYRAGVLVQQYSHALDGRLLSTTDAMGNTTSFSEVFSLVPGQTPILREVSTTTHPDPDGSGPATAPTSVQLSSCDGYVFETSGTANRPSRYEYGVSILLGETTPWRWTKHVLLGDGGQTTEWQKSYVDPLGRQMRVEYADGSIERWSYDNQGRTKKHVDPDGVTSLWMYGFGTKPSGQADAPERWSGEWTVTAIDLDQDGIVDFDGSDRVSCSSQRLVYDSLDSLLVPCRQSTSWVLTQVGNAASWTSVSEQVQEIRRDVAYTTGEVSKSRSIPQSGWTTSTSVMDRTSQARTARTTGPDGTYEVEVSQYGRSKSSSGYSSTNQLLQAVTYAYDARGRQNVVVDTRATPTTGDDRASTTSFDDLDRALTITTPAPLVGEPPQVTTTQYDALGRVTRVILPDSNSIYHTYNAKGDIIKSWGTGQYPVEYTYDSQGRVKTLRTWQQFDAATGTGTSGSATTTWNYSSTRGWMTSKGYQGAAGCTYTYTPAGRLQSRTWARGTGTTYTYNTAGDPASTDYADTTPDVVYSYDRRGRVANVQDALGTRSFTYDTWGGIDIEDLGMGLFDTIDVDQDVDTLGRRSRHRVIVDGDSVNTVDSQYDAATGRLASLVKSGQRMDLGYEQGSSRVVSWLYRDGVLATSPVVTTTTKSFDAIGRLRQVFNDAALAGAYDDRYDVIYNAANQRARVDLLDGSSWVYGYDALGQVTSGKRYRVGGANFADPLAGQQFEYTFDHIGNRLTAKMGGDAAGANLRQITYYRNLLNQYTSRTSLRAVDIMGFAPPASNVLVNTLAADARWGAYYQKLLTWPNGPQQLKTVDIDWDQTNQVPEETRQVLVPSHVFETFTHDLDGNLLQDATWQYEWDGENRLTAMQTPGNVDPSITRRRLEFVYDYQGRRCLKRVYVWVPLGEMMMQQAGGMSQSAGTAGLSEKETVEAEEEAPPAQSNGGSIPEPGTWQLDSTYKYVWDGWLLSLELDGKNNPIRSNAWGPDLSGSTQGAGGVGGLALMTDHLGNGGVGGAANTYHITYDHNGNVMSLRDRLGNTAARYEYGPFGESLTARDALAGTNPWRFSTKYADAETGLYYYGYRYYNASTGRWINRDPIGERDGPTTYALVSNAVPMHVDRLGMKRYVFMLEGFGGTSGMSDPYVKLDLMPIVRSTLADTEDGFDEDQITYTSWDTFGAVRKIFKHLTTSDKNTCKYNTLVIIGFSNGGAGAIDAVKLAAREKQLQVDTLFTVDPIPARALALTRSDSYKFTLPSNVTTSWNYYQRLDDKTTFRGHAVSGATHETQLEEDDFDNNKAFIDNAHLRITSTQIVKDALKKAIEETPLDRDEWRTNDK
jgi:RHS repeat-associated protein